MPTTIDSGLTVQDAGHIYRTGHIFVMSDGALFVVYYNGTNLVYRTKPRGGSWSTATTIAGPTVPGPDTPYTRSFLTRAWHHDQIEMDACPESWSAGQFADWLYFTWNGTAITQNATEITDDLQRIACGCDYTTANVAASVNAAHMTLYDAPAQSPPAFVQKRFNFGGAVSENVTTTFTNWRGNSDLCGVVSDRLTTLGLAYGCAPTGTTFVVERAVIDNASTATTAETPPALPSAPSGITALYDGVNFVFVANCGGQLYYLLRTGTNTYGSWTAFGDASGVVGRPTLTTRVGTNDLCVIYQSTKNQANGEIWYAFRTGGVWGTTTLLAGGASTGWAYPSADRDDFRDFGTIHLTYVTGTASTWSLVEDTITWPTPAGTWLVGSADYGNVSSGTLPAQIPWAAGDYALVCAFNNAATIPSLPAGWTNIITSTSTGRAMRVGFRKLQAGDTSTGTWTSAQELQIAIFRNVSGIGASAALANAAGVFRAPALTLNVSDGSSCLAVFGGTTSSSDFANDVYLPGTQDISGVNSIAILGLNMAYQPGITSWAQTDYNNNPGVTNIVVSIELLGPTTPSTYQGLKRIPNARVGPMALRHGYRYRRPPFGSPAAVTTPVSSTLDVPYESLQGITQSLSDPLDETGGVASSLADPFESIQAILTTLTDPIEASQGIATTAADPVESTGGIASTGADPLEALRAIIAPQSDPIESSTGLATTSADPFEASQGLATTILVPFEATGGIAASAIDPLEALGAVATALSDPYEAAGAALTPVSTTSQAPFEAIQGIARALGIPLESLGGVASTGTDPLEAVAALAVTSLAPIEALTSIARTLVVPLEATGGIAQVAVLPVEALQGIAAPRSDPFEVFVLLGPGTLGAFDEPHTRPPAARGVLVVRVFDPPNPRRAQ